MDIDSYTAALYQDLVVNKQMGTQTESKVKTGISPFPPSFPYLHARFWWW